MFCLGRQGRDEGCSYMGRKGHLTLIEWRTKKYFHLVWAVVDDFTPELYGVGKLAMHRYCSMGMGVSGFKNNDSVSCV